MKKVLVANRGEIATRIFRACKELSLKTVAIFAKEDELSVHRFKADEAYLVGAGKKPVEAYLDIEDIIRIAKENNVDAIHPGYGFLSENEEFARRCEEEGLTFIGPKVAHLHMFGDKLEAKAVAEKAGITTIPGTKDPVTSFAQVKAFADKHGYPIMLKAALGGGGRGMRIVHKASELKESYERAKSEAMQSFGSDEMYLEKYLQSPKHIEVQILADQFGNVLHLFERDCSVQRRNQKVVEIAPSVTLPLALRKRICDAAVRLMQSVHYVNAATVEFLVEKDQFYFVEVNPRVQVEHTVTELITDRDIVQSQILIAQGKNLFTDLHFPQQKDLTYQGAAIQCRITTEDPTKKFMPDTGTIETYRSPGGNGVRLDVGNAYSGAVITPFFDSLLVKVCVHDSNFKDTAQKMLRVLNEFMISGVHTNIGFLKNVIAHPVFQSGEATTTFIDENPSLFDVPSDANPTNKLLTYISNITVNGTDGIPQHEKKYYPEAIEKLQLEPQKVETSKDILDAQGVSGLQTWIAKQDQLLLTDTTLRDAHQSLFATRMRTHDMLPIANQIDRGIPQLFSAEAWGGATFDVAYRFLHEDPWVRLRELRKRMPHTMLQMLFRGSNAVGYQNYPDNVIQEFIKLAAKNGIDVFRIFDSLNWVPQLETSIQAVRDTGKVAEATMCYTGDILDSHQKTYTLKYYTDLAKELEQAGAQILAIKDMAGVLKPEAAYQLISTLKEKLMIPIHLHTHDTTGNGIATYLSAAKAGVDIVDVAASSMSGTTSQPSMSSLYYAMAGTKRQPTINSKNVEEINRYWKGIRPFYQDFENGMTGSQTDIYQTQMPGGQYSNLQQQAQALGLKGRFEDVKHAYRQVNQLFGDIIKVTPSSKVVGDMALFMVENKLTPDAVLKQGDHLDFPQSVVDFFAGNLGQPVNGFPKQLQKLVLKNHPAITVRPGSLAKPVDFDAFKKDLDKKLKRDTAPEEVISAILYPKVFEDFDKFEKTSGPVTKLDTATFFQGIRRGETVDVEIRHGVHLIIKLDQLGEVDEQGRRTLYFEVNGRKQDIIVRDLSVHDPVMSKRKAEPTNANEIGATMSGSVLNVSVAAGDKISKGTNLLVTEAMKMETTIQAPFDCVIKHVYVAAGDVVDTNDLLIEIAPQKL
ncbi:Pyruvate carboxylase [Pediococcus damnosus]|uniref:Pyruvate carboxylase n=1 Tax=Pediococcus damnosus TaxID=51663 RepID=A0ABM6A2B7_9LACO|nr:pyruvate carboxylase [Pediococcus damnosus]AMV66229.1 Pyruvate carboxylase [Pediococcus damnosus]KRN49960.1 pyruvate carboxylase [Pediococcus damnosus]PJE50154.1 pyruvate carboxylase [Pediococcus damnosus]GEA93612.1 pyruvate carboxylase [Pediococcus damnosus]